MKHALSVILLLAPQKCGRFFSIVFIYAGVRLLTRAL